MNKLFLIEVMRNKCKRSSDCKNKIKGEDEINIIKKRFKILKDKTEELSENDPRKIIIKNDFINLVREMNNYFINNKCN